MWLASLSWSIAIALGLAATPIVSRAQSGDYPTKAVRLIVPYAAGGVPDSVSRLIAPRLGDKLGQSVWVDNRPGGGGVIAAQALMSGASDGYSFLLTDAAMLSITPMMLKDVPYDPIKDFVPVSLIARAPNFLAVHPSVPANSFQEFIALSKEKPGTLNCGSAGNGTIHHLTLEAMKAAFGADIVHVPFKGSGQSVPALIGGQIQCVLAALPALSGFRKTGQAKIIAIASAKRSPLAPDIPAMGEGVPDFNFATIIGVLARVGTPNTAIQRISLETTMIAKDTAVAQALAAMGIEAVGAGAREYAQALLSDAEQMKKAVRAADIKLRQ